MKERTIEVIPPDVMTPFGKIQDVLRDAGIQPELTTGMTTSFQREWSDEDEAGSIGLQWSVELKDGIGRIRFAFLMWSKAIFEAIFVQGKEWSLRFDQGGIDLPEDLTHLLPAIRSSVKSPSEKQAVDIIRHLAEYCAQRFFP